MHGKISNTNLNILLKYHKIWDGDSVLFPIDPNINLGN